ncbi:MAG: hypothetical protein OSB70_09930 [Myxococcota bacterium]|nr:hypothetical protein [Myxococcota bacterium]
MSQEKPSVSGRQDEGVATGRRLRLLGLICMVLFLADFFVDKHGHHAWENLPGAYGFFGLLACGVLALVASLLRKFVERDEDYYD